MPRARLRQVSSQLDRLLAEADCILLAEADCILAKPVCADIGVLAEGYVN